MSLYDEPVLIASLSTFPPELQILIISLVDLTSVVKISQTSRSFRELCSTSEEVWITPLDQAAIGHGVYQRQSSASLTLQIIPDRRSYRQLTTLGRNDIIPSQVWLHLIPYLSRNFLLYSMELPRLTSRIWQQICKIRFLRSTLESEERRTEEDNMNGRDRDSASSWRRFFLRELSRLEHRVENNCTHNEHFCQYLVLHRNKEYGLTTARIATRNYNPLAIFQEYKLQNGLSDRESVRIPIPRHLGPVDLEIYFLVTLGKEQSFLRNEVAMDILTSIGQWKEGKNKQAILGPVLITATIRPSLDPFHSTRLNLTDSYIRVEPQDLTDITPLTRNCYISHDYNDRL